MGKQDRWDNVPYEENGWLKRLPEHLRKTAVTLQDYFELQPRSQRAFTRSAIRKWLTEMRNRSWLVEQYNALAFNLPIWTIDPGKLAMLDAGSDAPGFSKTWRQKKRKSN